jgi:hypothetical protein
VECREGALHVAASGASSRRAGSDDREPPRRVWSAAPQSSMKGKGPGKRST